MDLPEADNYEVCYVPDLRKWKSIAYIGNHPVIVQYDDSPVGALEKALAETKTSPMMLMFH